MNTLMNIYSSNMKANKYSVNRHNTLHPYFEFMQHPMLFPSYFYLFQLIMKDMAKKMKGKTCRLGIAEIIGVYMYIYIYIYICVAKQ